MSKLKLPKLYPITDAQLSGLSHAEQIARLAAGGATLVQLREKRATPREFYHEAEAALRVARERGVLVVINDRADIALALQSNSVHLGQDDLDPVAARRLLGPDAVIGYSTHNIEQALEAAQLPITYLAVGPIFATRTKEHPDPAIGLDGLRRVRAQLDALAARIPLVAIGGITTENARAVLDAGADSVAVISALLCAPEEITRRTAELMRVLKRV